jgi:anti-sigma factor RsiW
MSNSELPSAMEEKWTAYLDGRLSAAEAAAFERENAGAAAEKIAAAKIGGALRAHLSAPALRNAEFFNAGILKEISPPEVRSRDSQPARRPFWSLWRMAAAGACCLLAAGSIYEVFVSGGEQPRNGYQARVLSAKAGDQELYATVLDADGLAVVWIDGFDHLADDYVLE